MAANTSINTSQPQQPQQASSSQNQNTKPVGTGFVNLQSYLNANNPSNLASNVAGNVSNATNQYTQNLGQSQNQYSTQAGQEQNRLSGLQSGAQNTLNQIVNAPGSTTYSLDANGNPVQNLVSTGDVSNYGNYLGAQYSGPTGLNNTNQLQNQQTQAQNYANLLGSQGGQQQLLRTFVNQPGYTNNLQNLDTMLLGGNQQAQGQLKNARTQALQQLASNNVNNINSLDAQQAQLAGQGLSTQQQNLAGQATTEGTNINNALNTQLQNLSAQNTAAQNEYQNIASGNSGAAVDANGNPVLSAAQQAVVQAAQQNGWAAPGQLVNFNNGTPLTPASVANQQQAAQLAALAQLQGTGANALSGPIGGAQAASLDTSGIIGAGQQAENSALAGNFSQLHNMFGNNANAQAVLNNPWLPFIGTGSGADNGSDTIGGTGNQGGVNVSSELQSLLSKNPASGPQAAAQLAAGQALQQLLNQYYGLGSSYNPLTQQQGGTNTGLGTTGK